jgi:hypothetical protein
MNLASFAIEQKKQKYHHFPGNGFEEIGPELKLNV